MALAALVVSILAAVVSGFALWRQVKWAKVAATAEKQAASAQTRIAMIEEVRHSTEQRERERATLHVRIDPVGTNSHMLVVANESPTATAYDVTVDLESRAAGAVPDLRDSPFPATIPPRAETTAFLSENLTTATQFTATLKWRDGEGSHEERRDLSIQ